MNQLHLSFRNIAGSPFRSGFIFGCVLLVAGSTLWAILVGLGAQEDLKLGLDRMESPGVDLVIIPRGIGHSSVGMENVDMAGLLAELAAIPGVSQVSPQLHFLTQSGSPYTPEAELFVVAFDPATDFSVLAWLPDRTGFDLEPGEAISGSLLSLPPGEQSYHLAGYALKPLAQLSPTGTSLDHSLLVTFETARAMFLQPQNEPASQVDRSSIPSMLVKLHPGSDLHQVTGRILKDIPGVTVIDHTEFLRLGYDQLTGLLRKIPVMLGLVCGLSLFFIGTAFTITVSERKREIGVLRALGSTRIFVLRSLLLESFILALGGWLTGITASLLVEALFRDQIAASLVLPLASITPSKLFLMAGASLGLAFASVFLAVLLPAWMISRKEPAVAFRS
jgi:putative ABC transport system permease protein